MCRGNTLEPREHFITNLFKYMLEQSKSMPGSYSDDIPRKIETAASKAPALGSKIFLDAITRANKTTRTK